MSRFEMMIGAILTQNTAWMNVEKAIANLHKNGAIGIGVLKGMPGEQLAELIRPAGYFNQKAAYIKAMVETIDQKFSGSLNKLFSLETTALRKELLSWKGIGPETADCILLYAANRPVFVVDAYTRRVCLRHGWIDEKAAYEDIAGLFINNLPHEVPLFNEYHALIVKLAKEHCRTTPQCSGCPLEKFL